MKNQTGKNGTEYNLVAYVKETNQENGPGHVSVSAVKQKNGKSKVSHTSFFPGAFGSLLNAVTLGSIPVKGQQADSHKEDFDEANHVLVKKVGKEDYKKAKQAQKEFSEEVKTGQKFYSVFGRANPCASFLASAFSAFRNDYLTTQAYKKNNGFHPPEDMVGINIYGNDDHVDAGTSTPENCASSSAYILSRAGVSMRSPLIPNFFTDKLEEQGFEKIDKKEFEKKFGS